MDPQTGAHIIMANRLQMHDLNHFSKCQKSTYQENKAVVDIYELTSTFVNVSKPIIAAAALGKLQVLMMERKLRA